MSGLVPYLVAAIVGLLGFIGVYARGVLVGAARERAKDAALEALARDVADEVDNDLGAVPPVVQREELKKW
jgi:hypothetical protein